MSSRDVCVCARASEQASAREGVVRPQSMQCDADGVSGWTLLHDFIFFLAQLFIICLYHVTFDWWHGEEIGVRDHKEWLKHAQC